MASDDMYEDGSATAAPVAEKETAQPDDTAASALIPLSFFKEKPERGATCTVKVDKVYGDQAAVSLVSEDAAEMEPPGTSEMDDMMS